MAGHNVYNIKLFQSYLKSHGVQIRGLLVHGEPVLEVAVGGLTIDIVRAHKHPMALKKPMLVRQGTRNCNMGISELPLIQMTGGSLEIPLLSLGQTKMMTMMLVLTCILVNSSSWVAS